MVNITSSKREACVFANVVPGRDLVSLHILTVHGKPVHMIHEKLRECFVNVAPEEYDGQITFKNEQIKNTNFNTPLLGFGNFCQCNPYAHCTRCIDGIIIMY